MGVPKDAVKLKMNLEGLNGEIIFLEPTTLSSTALKKNKEMLSGAQPPPPPPPPLPGMTNLSGPIKIQALDLKNVKLKKTTIVERKKVEEVRDNRVPTKNQLLEQLNKLKNVKK